MDGEGPGEGRADGRADGCDHTVMPDSEVDDLLPEKSK